MLFFKTAHLFIQLIILTSGIFQLLNDLFKAAVIIGNDSLCIFNDMLRKPQLCGN